MKSEKPANKNDGLSNAASALLLLKEWLSISESQICSTEVLSEQLPKVNALLETSMNDISAHFSKLASNSQKISTGISEIDKSIDLIQIGGKEIEIPAHLTKLAEKTSDKETAKYLLDLAKKVKNQEDNLHSELKNTIAILKENSKELSEIVVGMQFQDRVSQNIMITINVMQAIVDYLNREVENSLPNITREDRKKLLNIDFAKQLIKTLRLGELQLSFVNHLIERGYIQKSSEVDFCIEDHIKKEDDDNIDLF